MASEAICAVALATGKVNYALATDPVADPLIHGEMPAEPVVLLWNVGQSAFSGQLERGHSLWLVLLDVVAHGGEQ